jgi:integrative and conjugative element protein (TIGR02256 family)
MTIDRVSADGRFALVVDEPVVVQLRRHCLASGGRETGGVMAGRYDSSHRVALVARVSGPPRGSQRGRFTFERAVGDLQEWLDGLWRQGNAYYLGEWHFHPGANPTPSGTDRSQMWRIADDPAYACPEPILLIVGGTPDTEVTCSTHVFVRGGTVARLDNRASPDPSRSMTTPRSRSTPSVK